MVFKQKMKNQKGFSLAETLLAVLILLLVSLIVASGLPAARNAYSNVILGSNARSLLSTAVSALRDELGTAWNIDVTGDEVTYYSADTGNRSILKNGRNGTIVIQEYVATDGWSPETDRNVTPRDLITIPNNTAGELSITYSDVSYDDTYRYGIDEGGFGVITIGKIQVHGAGAVIAEMDGLKIRVWSESP